MREEGEKERKRNPTVVGIPFSIFISSRER